MKIITVVGARPQFIKAAMISHAIVHYNIAHPLTPIEEKILHTGQHYDENMSHIFFEEMNIPRPTWQLKCNNTTHGAMTGNMLIEIEKILLKECPDYLLVYGDTNSTLAGALAASKLHIPIIHVEAGLRSFNKNMPEEINRILTDHVSTILCCPTKTAVENLKNEGIKSGVYAVGDVMYDAALEFSRIAEEKSMILHKLNLKSHDFYLMTLHRAENTDNLNHLKNIIDAISEISYSHHIVFPIHPRTIKVLKANGLLSKLQSNPAISIIEPLDFIDMIMLEKNASLILTDSGGIQKEAYFHQTPCITLREETEWIETVESGWNKLAGWKKKNILKAVSEFDIEDISSYKEIKEYGNGNTADKILELL